MVSLFKCCGKTVSEPASESLPKAKNKNSSHLYRVNCTINLLALATIAAFVTVVILLILSQCQIMPTTGAFYSFFGFIGLLFLTRLLDLYHDRISQNQEKEKKTPVTLDTV